MFFLLVDFWEKWIELGTVTPCSKSPVFICSHSIMWCIFQRLCKVEDLSSFVLCFLLFAPVTPIVETRHQGQGFLRSTKKCREKNQQIQIFNLFVMTPTFLSGQLLSKYIPLLRKK